MHYFFHSILYPHNFTETIDNALELLLQCARQGFALGLTVLIGTIHSIQLESLLKLIVDLLEVSSSMKGQVGFSLLCSFRLVLIRLLPSSCKFPMLIPDGIAGSKGLSFGSLVCLWCPCPIRKTNGRVNF